MGNKLGGGIGDLLWGEGGFQSSQTLSTGCKNKVSNQSNKVSNQSNSEQKGIFRCKFSFCQLPNFSLIFVVLNQLFLFVHF